jgi:hypothetical protein
MWLCNEPCLLSEKNYLQQLTACIRDVVVTVTHSIFQNVWAEGEYHLDTCYATRVAHNEIY